MGADIVGSAAGEPRPCPWCGRSTSARTDAQRPGVTRFECEAHGLVSAHVFLRNGLGIDIRCEGSEEV